MAFYSLELLLLSFLVKDVSGSISLSTESVMVAVGSRVTLTCNNSLTTSSIFYFNTSVKLCDCKNFTSTCPVTDSNLYESSFNRGTGFNTYTCTVKNFTKEYCGSFSCNETTISDTININYVANFGEPCGTCGVCSGGQICSSNSKCGCPSGQTNQNGTCGPTTTAAPTTTTPTSSTAAPTTTKAPTISTAPAAATSVATSTSAAATTAITTTITPSTVINKSTARTVTETSSSKSSNDTDYVAAIVGGSVGGALFLLISLGVALAVYKCRKSSTKPMGPNTAKHRSAKHHRHGGNVHTRKPNDRTLKSAYQSNQDRPFYGQYINPAYDGHDNNRKVVSGYQGFQPNPPPYIVYDHFSGEYVRSTDHRGSHPMGSGQRYTLHQPSQQRARVQPTGY